MRGLWGRRLEAAGEARKPSVIEWAICVRGGSRIPEVRPGSDRRIGGEAHQEKAPHGRGKSSQPASASGRRGLAVWGGAGGRRGGSGGDEMPDPITATWPHPTQSSLCLSYRSRNAWRHNPFPQRLYSLRMAAEIIAKSNIRMKPETLKEPNKGAMFWLWGYRRRAGISRRKQWKRMQNETRFAPLFRLLLLTWQFLTVALCI